MRKNLINKEEIIAYLKSSEIVKYAMNCIFENTDAEINNSNLHQIEDKYLNEMIIIFNDYYVISIGALDSWIKDKYYLKEIIEFGKILWEGALKVDNIAIIEMLVTIILLENKDYRPVFFEHDGDDFFDNNYSTYVRTFEKIRKNIANTK